jgi:site-specific recombinase XerC
LQSTQLQIGLERCGKMQVCVTCLVWTLLRHSICTHMYRQSDSLSLQQEITSKW